MRTSVVRQMRNYNRKGHMVKIGRGDWVWLYDYVNANKKLGSPWKGPFLVINQLSEVTLELQKEEFARSKVVHINDVRPCNVAIARMKWLKPLKTLATRVHRLLYPLSPHQHKLV